MDNAKQQNVISVNSQVMELQQLIAGPLVSTIEADTLSSRRYLEMLQLIAFEDVTELLCLQLEKLPMSAGHAQRKVSFW